MDKDALRQSPLHSFHQRAGARFVPFAGYEMPVQYTGILEEHRAVRQAAGLFDVSHMAEARVSGPQTWDFIQYLLTNDFSKITEGRAIYSPMCTPDGGCIDDLIVYCIGPEEAFICLNAANRAKDIAWMQQQIADFDCQVEDISDSYAQLALQGPAAPVILDRLCEVEHPASRIKRFRAQSLVVGGKPCFVSRTGYTGEDGFELYCSPADAEAVAEAIARAGAPEGLMLTGLGARDSLRLEAGYPLYGHEIDHNISPVEGGVAWTVKPEKPGNFIGRAVLRQQIEQGATRKLVFFLIGERRIARQGMKVFLGDEEVGEVRSGTQSPSLNQPIGSALIRAEVESKGLEVEIRKERYPLALKKPPLHL